MRRLSAPALLAAASLSLAAPATAQWNGTGPIWTRALVGIGGNTPQARLGVFEPVGQNAIQSESLAPQGRAVHGIAYGPDSIALNGVSWPTSGNTIGVAGTVWSSEGKAISGYSGATSGDPVAIYGEQQGSNGYSGYFKGGNFQVLQGTDGFIGFGRTRQINSTEILGVYRQTDGWGGMYIETGTDGKPYYGYAVGQTAMAYHHYDSRNHEWVLVCGGPKITVQRYGTFGGIGTSAPNYALHVNGSAGKPGGGSWSNASDRRLKEDIEPIEGALDRLLSVRGVTYRYIDPGAIQEREGTQLGVIAQEVEEAFPDWVDEGKDGYKRVTFRGFEGVTIEALRELRDENERLRAELRETNATLSDLAGRLEALESR